MKSASRLSAIFAACQQRVDYIESLTRVWQAFTTIPDLSATREQWEQELGEDYDYFEKFLRPTGMIAQLCELDERKLAEDISKALTIDTQLTKVETAPHTWQLGCAQLPSKEQRPVFLSFQERESGYQEILSKITARYGTNLVLLMPSVRQFGVSTDFALEATFSIRIGALTDLIGLDSSGRLTAFSKAAEQLGLPKPDRQQEYKPWPDPKRYTTAKYWTKKDGSFCLSTKTNGRRNGKVQFALREDGKPTYQTQFMQLLCYHWPKPAKLKHIIEEVYFEDSSMIHSGEKRVSDTLRNIRGLVSDIRIKKLRKAGINPDILPSLSIASSLETGISLQVAKLHRVDDKMLDDADRSALD